MSNKVNGREVSFRREAQIGLESFMFNGFSGMAENAEVKTLNIVAVNVIFV